jgi:hypothetical protein
VRAGQGESPLRLTDLHLLKVRVSVWEGLLRDGDEGMELNGMM